MARLFLILVAIALVIWIGQRYYADHPNGLGFLDSTGSSSSTPTPAAGSPTPTPTPSFTDRAKGWRKTLWGVTQKTLTPLDQKDFSSSEVTRTLEATERDMELHRPDPGYKNLTTVYNQLTQACLVLHRALQERQNYTQRYERDAATPTPPASALTMAPLQTTQGLTPASSPADNNAFFQGRVTTEWHERCGYYEPIIDGLLMGPNGAN